MSCGEHIWGSIPRNRRSCEVQYLALETHVGSVLVIGNDVGLSPCNCTFK